MATATLASREIPPEAPAPVVNPNPNMETTYTGNTGNDMGISSMGFRSAKFNPSEWHETNYAKYYQPFVDRDNAERAIHESKRTVKETEETTTKLKPQRNLQKVQRTLSSGNSNLIEKSKMLLMRPTFLQQRSLFILPQIT